MRLNVQRNVIQRCRPVREHVRDVVESNHRDVSFRRRHGRGGAQDITDPGHHSKVYRYERQGFPRYSTNVSEF